ncbi:scn4ab [Symbiodinium sp. CCMP2592]|nr:scn4ab [Symbiodinium sp. CCMP2592]
MGEPAVEFTTDSDPTTVSGEMDKLRFFLDSEFAHQREMRQRQDGLLAEIYDKVCQIQIKPLHPRPEPPRTSVPSVDEERSITSLYSPGSLEGPRAGGRGRASTDGSVSSVLDDSGKDHSADGDGFQSDRQLAEKRKVRGSYRHSFVRKAQLKHEETAAAASLRLASLKAYSLKAAPETGALRALGQAVVTSSIFTGTITFLIFLNVVLLGVEVDMSANLGQDEVPLWFGTVNAIIVLIFVLEVFLKCLAYGLYEFWCGDDSKWNIFDSCIIAVSVVETLIDIWAQMMAHSMATSTHLRLMRSLRLARALRGVRVVRLFRYVSALRTLVLCIVSTMASLVWTLVLLVLIFYTFGVILTQLVTDHCRDAAVLDSGGDLNAVPICDASLARYWQSVPHSMLTLFMSISGGVSWEDALRPLEAVSPLAVGLMVCYIVLTVLAVLNVVTGVFCNTAIESAHADKDVAAIKQIHKQAAQVQSLQNIFREMDTENCNVVSLQEFEEAMSQQKMASFLQSMGISTEDVWTLFMIMDADRSGLIDLEEFVSGCMKLCGPAKSLQFAMMSYENKLTRQAIKHLNVETADIRCSLARLEARAALPPLREPVALKVVTQL